MRKPVKKSVRLSVCHIFLSEKAPHVYAEKVGLCLCRRNL